MDTMWIKHKHNHPIIKRKKNNKFQDRTLAKLQMKHSKTGSTGKH